MINNQNNGAGLLSALSKKNIMKSIQEAKNLERNQLVICECPEWNSEGLQIAIWNGEEFEYDGQPNDTFNGLVTGFIRLWEDIYSIS